MLLLRGLYQGARVLQRLEWHRALSASLALLRRGYRHFPPRSAADFNACAEAHRRAGGHTLQAAPYFAQAAALAPQHYLAPHLLDLYDTGRITTDTARQHLASLAAVQKPTHRLLLKAMLYDLGLHAEAESIFADVHNDTARFACFDTSNTQQQRFSTDYAAFVDYLRQHRDSIAIVGNSPCELGRGKGDEIDAHAVVIRLNNFVTEPPFAQDYGQKATVWVRGRNRMTRERPEDSFDFIIYAASHLFSHPFDWGKKVLPYQQRGSGTVTFNDLYYRLYHKLGAPPSSGLLTIQAVCDILGEHAKPNCYGFAFTDHLQPGARSHYFERFTISRQHDWVKEAEYFKALIG